MKNKVRGYAIISSTVLIAFSISVAFYNNHEYIVSKLMNEKNIQFVVNIVAIISGISGVIIGLSGWRATNLDAVKEYFQQGDTEEFIKARGELYDKQDHNKNIEYDSKEASMITNFFQFWGLMVGKRYLPIWVFEGASGMSVVRLYGILENYIVKHREKNKYYAQNFE